MSTSIGIEPLAARSSMWAAHALPLSAWIEAKGAPLHTCTAHGLPPSAAASLASSSK